MILGRLRTATAKAITLGLLIAATTIGLGTEAPRAQFESEQCFNALMMGPSGLKPVAEKAGASHSDYVALLAANINVNIASGQPLIHVADLWDMRNLSVDEKVAMRNTIAKLRSAIADYIVVALASELRRVTPRFLTRDGRFTPPAIKSVRPLGTPPTRYAYDIAPPPGDYGVPIPAISLLVGRDDCKLVDMGLANASFLTSIGQDIKTIGDLAEAERQLRAKSAEIAAAQ